MYTSGNSYLIPAIVAIIIFLLYMVAMQLTNRQESTRERLRRLTSEPEESQDEIKTQLDKEEAEPVAEPLRQDVVTTPIAVPLEKMLHAMGADTETFRKESQLRFYRAGIHSPDAPIFYLFFKRIGFLVFLLIALLLIARAGNSAHPMSLYLAAMILVFLGIMGPELFLRNQRSKAEKVLQRSFPDALDLLLVCVESGLALDGALARVCKELGRAHPAITQELNRTRIELTLLNDRTQALNNLAERTDMLSFRSLVVTLLQSERFGTSLTDTLRVLSEDFRQTRLMIAEDKAGRLPALMTIPLITLMLPALFMIILGPAIIGVMAALAANPMP